MKFAVLSADTLFVDNIIIANADQKEELQMALGRKLLSEEVTTLGLAIGDFYNGVAWTRNIDGEQVTLSIGDNPLVDEVLAMLEEDE